MDCGDTALNRREPASYPLNLDLGDYGDKRGAPERLALTEAV